MVSAPLAPTDDDAPPGTHSKLLRWLRAHLFSSWINGLTTILVGTIAILALNRAVMWALVDATWKGTPETCAAGAGACWAAVGDSLGFILFGPFPFEARWRPGLAIVIMLATILLSCLRQARRWWLGLVWLITVLVVMILMYGALVIPVPDLTTAPISFSGGSLPSWPLLLVAALAILSGLWFGRRRGRLGGWPLAVVGGGGLLAIGLILSGVAIPGLALLQVPFLPIVGLNLWGGLPLTMILAGVGIIVGFPFGVLLALGRRSELPVIRTLSVTYIEVVRGVPLVTVLFMATIMFPLFLPPHLRNSLDQLWRAEIGIIMFIGAYLAEVVRGGLQALPKGQYEAADALGLSYWRKMRLIILPQALQLSIPPMVNQFIATFKDTSLVVIIGLFDLMTAAKAALKAPTWRIYYLEVYLFVAIIYFAFCFFMSKYSQSLERSLAKGTRRG